jgi:hypothetical protein
MCKLGKYTGQRGEMQAGEEERDNEEVEESCTQI